MTFGLSIYLLYSSLFSKYTIRKCTVIRRGDLCATFFFWVKSHPVLKLAMKILLSRLLMYIHTYIASTCSYRAPRHGKFIFSDRTHMVAHLSLQTTYIAQPAGLGVGKDRSYTRRYNSLSALGIFPFEWKQQYWHSLMFLTPLISLKKNAT